MAAASISEGGIAAALALFFAMLSGVRAEEPAAITLPQPQKQTTAYAGATTGKVVYSDASRQVSLAMCGIEGHGKAFDLDAGLLDYNVADPARAIGGAAEEAKQLGRSQFDYRSSVVLGVNLGYRF